jgi:acylphosphatase
MADQASKQPLILHLMISGRVQGVSYRVWLKAEADARGLSGWTRNRANGDVEAVLAGPHETVRALCEICRSGPPMARVDQILMEEVEQAVLEAGGAMAAFAVLPSV